ncbi:cytochrome b [Aureimonas flava]|uniref:Cytochrome b n=2 Tax=Aureimonas flava TaxID=2320271 RepID=A0A3A1WGK4_9HYPH|nr:cytochrome b [Aureimonas flava]
MIGAGRLRDTPQRYGLVSRALHWAAAYLLLWQFATLLGWRWLGDGPVMRAVSLLGPYHGTVGVLILALLLPRMAWSLVERRRRPRDAPTALGRLRAGVHGAFYALMLLVPGLALARAYGNGKGYELWEIALIPATGVTMEWLVAPADLLHGPLAWTLAALIAGHVSMALIHHFARGDETLRRMAGALDDDRAEGDARQRRGPRSGR